MPEAHKHHFVPKFLLRAWAQDDQLRGYWWDARKNALICKRCGVDAFCFKIDLLTLTRSEIRRDVIEQAFFGLVDARGAAARDKILTDGVRSLTASERSDFARLLMSLEMRQPEMVAQLRAFGSQWTSMLNSDAEVLAKMKARNIPMTPVEYWLSHGGSHLDDRAMKLILGLVDNKRVGPLLINAHWHLVTLKPGEETFVLSDRPLMRFLGLENPSCYWVLPLSPLHAFVATLGRPEYDAVRRMSPRRFALGANVHSARQAKRFVITTDERHAEWLGKYIPRSQPQPAAPISIA